MAHSEKHDSWSAGQSYEHYMGRWSQLIALEFLAWLNAPRDLSWLDVGSGTGALTRNILEKCAPKSVIGIEPSEGFVNYARKGIADPRVEFHIAGAEQLPVGDSSVDVAASALVLNFVPEKVKALHEMQRVLRPGGTLAFYVWDYPGGGMGFIDAFWKVAASLDAAAGDLDEGKRFPFCTVEGLSELCHQAAIADPKIEAIEVVTEFPDFNAFWHPFTLGAGPAPGYCNSLSEQRRQKLKQQLAAKIGTVGPICLPARAWAVKVNLP